MRSSWVAYPHAKRPLTQECPALAPPSLSGTMRTSSSPRISALKEQPTPQYAHVVMTDRVGAPIVSKVFSVRAPVGQA